MYTIGKWKKGRFWAVWDAAGHLVCVCVYRRGAKAVKERLEEEGRRDG